MQNGDDNDHLVRDLVVDTERKSPQHRASSGSMYLWIRGRMNPEAFEDCLCLIQEFAAESGSLRFIPSRRFLEISLGLRADTRTRTVTGSCEFWQ